MESEIKYLLQTSGIELPPSVQSPVEVVEHLCEIIEMLESKLQSVKKVVLS